MTSTEAQREFDTTPTLQELLRRASESQTVRRTRDRIDH
jgi:hypothetical protein